MQNQSTAYYFHCYGFLDQRLCCRFAFIFIFSRWGRFLSRSRWGRSAGHGGDTSWHGGVGGDTSRHGGVGDSRWHGGVGGDSRWQGGVGVIWQITWWRLFIF